MPNLSFRHSFCDYLLGTYRAGLWGALHPRQIINNCTNKFREWQVPSRTKAGRYDGFWGMETLV